MSTDLKPVPRMNHRAKAPTSLRKLPRLAINGFGRVGRNVLRVLSQKGRVGQVVAINGPCDAERSRQGPG